MSPPLPTSRPSPPRGARPVLRARDLALPRPAKIGPTEASHLLGVSTAVVRRWGDDGRLTVERTGSGHRRYDRAQVEALAAGGSVGPSAADLRAEAVERWRGSVAAGMSEAALLSQVRDLARVLGWLGCHTHRSDRSEPGFPDLVLVRGPVVLWRELKTQRGPVRTAQALWLDRLRAAGQDAGVWRPADLVAGRVEAQLRGPA